MELLGRPRNRAVHVSGPSVLDQQHVDGSVTEEGRARRRREKCGVFPSGSLREWHRSLWKTRREAEPGRSEAGSPGVPCLSCGSVFIVSDQHRGTRSRREIVAIPRTKKSRNTQEKECWSERTKPVCTVKYIHI